MKPPNSEHDLPVPQTLRNIEASLYLLSFYSILFSFFHVFLLFWWGWGWGEETIFFLPSLEGAERTLQDENN